MPFSVDLGRHAVGAAEIAAIDDGDPQIAQAAPARVLHGARGRDAAD